MHSRALITILIVPGLLLSFVLLSGCTEEQSSGEQSANRNKKVSVAKKNMNKETAQEEEKKEPEYRYSRVNKRDPFEPLIEVKKPQRQDLEKKAAVPVEELTPLQKVEVGSLRLLGIIVGKGEPRAMVDAPDGKSYILKKGTKVGKNSGVVDTITATTVLVKERYQDFSGDIHENIVEIGLPDREGDR